MQEEFEALARARSRALAKAREELGREERRLFAAWLASPAGEATIEEVERLVPLDAEGILWDEGSSSIDLFNWGEGRVHVRTSRFPKLGSLDSTLSELSPEQLGEIRTFLENVWMPSQKKIWELRKIIEG